MLTYLPTSIAYVFVKYVTTMRSCFTYCFASVLSKPTECFCEFNACNITEYSKFLFCSWLFNLVIVAQFYVDIIEFVMSFGFTIFRNWPTCALFSFKYMSSLRLPREVRSNYFIGTWFVLFSGSKCFLAHPWLPQTTGMNASSSNFLISAPQDLNLNIVCCLIHARFRRPTSLRENANI